MSKYYDGAKLLSMSDINGEKPEIYICTSNRTAGKTTFFNSWAFRKYLKQGEKFILIYRYNYELDGVADKFFKDIKTLFFPDMNMFSKRRANGIYHELFTHFGTDETVAKSCGYAITLNSADQIKKYSHLFADAQRMIFDEFQSETNHYCADEITKLLSIHTSIARGNGEQVRYVPVIMLSNPVSLINPYYTALGISSRLKAETKFLRGEGFVLEQSYNDYASKAQQESAFNRAFSISKYVAYSTQNVYLNDNTAFIGKPDGQGRYLCTLKYKGVDYGVREYANNGIIYCDDRPDKTFKSKIAVTTDDHNINYVMLKANEFFIASMRYYFEKGCFRFKDLRSKEAVMTAISY